MDAGELADVAVIGAGPAGSLAAARLARSGRQVVVLERAAFPRPAIGESLLPICNDLLHEAGLLEPVRQAGFMVKHGATFLAGSGRERFAFADALPGDGASAFQVPRDAFDQVLADAAAALGAAFRFRHEVSEVEFSPDCACLRVRDLESQSELTLRARHVLDCSGPARVLPRLLGLVKQTGAKARVACFTQVAVDARPDDGSEGDIWVCCHPEGGWTWIIPFADGRTSVGFVWDAQRWDALAGDDGQRLLARLESDPNVQRRLGPVAPLFAPRALRNYAASVSALYGDRWALVGHSGEFVDPVLSSGVALSLLAAHHASELVDRTLAGEAVDWERAYAQPLGRAVSVYRAFVDAWYQGTLPAIFFAAEKPVRVRRRITSILGGYALRDDNPLSRAPETALATLSRYSSGQALPRDRHKGAARTTPGGSPVDG